MMPLAIIGVAVIGILVGAGAFYLIKSISFKKDEDDEQTK